MSRRLAALAAAVGAVAFACRPIPAPDNGVLSLSAVKLPSPGVVVGDTMRDSIGNAAPVRVVAYGTGGESDTITTTAATFIVFDRGAHVSPEGYVIGDSVRDTPVRIIGSVGTLQTSPTDVFVTPLPDSLASSTAIPTDTVAFTPLDSAASANVSADLAGTVLATGASPAVPVQAVIVRYTILYAPPGVNGAVSGLLVDPAGRPSSVDTSDASGQVSRRIRVRPQAPSAIDSFVVSMSAEYAGVPLRGSARRLVVPIHSILGASH
jgi:hypothetical protein